MALTREQLLDTVARSPACVAAQDKAAWLALFADDGVVEDPVGTSPNRRGARPDADGNDELGRFWDLFIRGNEIRFEVARDLIAGDELLRDVVIHTTLDTGLRIEVPAHLLYQVSEGPGGPRLRRLRAVWDLRQRSLKAIGAGLLGIWTLCVISVRMFRIQGIGGVLGYSKGLITGILGQGRRAVAGLATAIAAGDTIALQALLCERTGIEFPVGTTLSAKAFLETLGSGARLTATKITPSGWLTSFGYVIEGGGARYQGVAVLEIDPTNDRVSSARFFAE